MDRLKVMIAVSNMRRQVEDDFHMLESVDINVMVRSFPDPGPWAQTSVAENGRFAELHMPRRSDFLQRDGNFRYCRPVVFRSLNISQRHIHHGAGRTPPPEYDQTGAQALQVKAHEQRRNQGQEQGYVERHFVVNF